MSSLWLACSLLRCSVRHALPFALRASVPRATLRQRPLTPKQPLRGRAGTSRLRGSLHSTTGSAVEQL